LRKEGTILGMGVRKRRPPEKALEGRRDKVRREIKGRRACGPEKRQMLRPGGSGGSRVKPTNTCSSAEKVTHRHVTARSDKQEDSLGNGRGNGK